MRKKNTQVLSPEDKDRVREGSDSKVRVRVFVQVHVSGERVAKEFDS